MYINPSDAELLLDLKSPLPASAIPADMHQIFCETMSEDLDKLHLALNDQDTMTVKALAHRMKGAFEVLSVPAGAAACRRLEQLSAAHDDPEQLNQLSAALRNYLREFLPS